MSYLLYLILNKSNLNLNYFKKQDSFFQDKLKTIILKFYCHDLNQLIKIFVIFIIFNIQLKHVSITKFKYNLFHLNQNIKMLILSIFYRIAFFYHTLQI